MATGRREEIGVRIHTDLLDCSICTNPLRPPVKQCENGHVVCRSCWSKLKHKCPICNLTTQCRNITLDKVLKAAHLPCTYANLGCRKSVSYSQWQVHTDTCEFGPSLCPIPGCAHKAFSGEWLGHFLEGHRFPRNHFIYGQSCNVLFNKGDLYYTLLGPGEDLFLLVKEPIHYVGNAIYLYYLDVTHPGNFPYELEVVGRYNCITKSVQLKSQAVSFKQWKRGQVRGSSLLVPLGFTESRNMRVRVLISSDRRRAPSRMVLSI